MKVLLSWLQDYVDVTLPPPKLAQKLTLAGFEVTEIINTGGDWGNIIVGQIMAINPHPDADRLRLATVDTGAGAETVVCGAPNLTIGDKIAFACLGARLTNPHNGHVEELKPAKIRGVISRGMICSEKELGISESHEGILVLPADAAVGRPLAEHLGGIVLDIDVTPNRPDCLSVISIAQETAALTGQKMHVPEISYAETGDSIDGQIVIEITDSDLCPRYCASLISGVKITESPAWLQERLIVCGMRPINNVVDITNYVMLEYGQPLHSFDYDRLKKKQIVVRRAKEDEKLYTLDTNERDLTSDMLVIADGERAVAIAGVMGGLNSEVTEDTTTILLEAASFKATSIHYTSRHLGLISEASMRFERGISAGLTLPALRHATQLIAELSGGKAARGVLDIYPGKKEPQPITLIPGEVKRIVGVAYSPEQIVSALEALGFECRTDGQEISVTAPYWRSDIKYDVDLIEEVARIIGYDEIPTTMLSEAIPHRDPELGPNLSRQIRNSLAGYGFQEIMTYTFTSPDILSGLTPDRSSPEQALVRIANPMTTDQEYLRPSLRAGLLNTLAANLRHDEGGIRLFELGKIFLHRENDLPAEPEVLCGILSGPTTERSWLGGGEESDFYDVKGLAEGLFGRLGIGVSFEKSADAGLHPARQAAVVTSSNGQTVNLGVIGEVHPKVAAAFEVDGTAGLFEVDVTALLPLVTGQKAYRQVPRFPGIIRDIALVVDTDISHGQILEVIQDFSLIADVELFDVYAGKQLMEGKKSLAYRLFYQSPAHTLTDTEVNKVQERLLNRLAKELGATLRS